MKKWEVSSRYWIYWQPGTYGCLLTLLMVYLKQARTYKGGQYVGGNEANAVCCLLPERSA